MVPNYIMTDAHKINMWRASVLNKNEDGLAHTECNLVIG